MSYRAPAGLSLHHCRVPNGVRAEWLQSDGKLAASWASFEPHLNRLSAEQLQHSRASLNRLLKDQGITYTQYQPNGQNKLWALDPLPLMFSYDEWQFLQQALGQRARLFNAILQDLYGEQRLLRENQLPAELMLSQPGFLWPCVGIQPIEQTFLHSYAVDLARSPDGRWWAIADRTQAPSGAGYALANRLAISRLWGQAFKELQIEPLASFFQAMKANLERLAPTEAGESPHIALLTPGPYSETYFEHSYLARYLGFTLVEGQDLQVRNDRLYLKTLTGLKRVHGLVRRLDEDYCDPLELRSDSALGVPGLLECLRAKTLVMANPPGTGVLETSGLLAFLPSLCEQLLGESLLLPSVASWWCGEPDAARQTLAALPERVIKPARPACGFEPYFGPALNFAEQDRLRQAIQHQPKDYVGQEWVSLSQAPIWHQHSLQSRPLGLRFYLCATEQGYQLMPGALARVAEQRNMPVISLQRGGISKDVWLTNPDKHPRNISLLPRNQAASPVQRQTAVSSRLAENLYWQGRYAARCEDQIRFWRLWLNTQLEDNDLISHQALKQVGESLEQPSGPELLLSSDTGSLRFNLDLLLASVNSMRERLSVDHQHSLNRIRQQLKQPSPQQQVDWLEYLDQMQLWLLALSGLEQESLTRDASWQFQGLGRRLERVSFLSRVVPSLLTGQAQVSQLECLLELCDSRLTCHARYFGLPQPLPVLDLLLLDDSNPRSIAFQLSQLRLHLMNLSPSMPQIYRQGVEALLNRLQDMRPSHWLHGEPSVLRQYSAELDALLYRLSDQLTAQYFSHSTQRVSFR